MTGDSPPKRRRATKWARRVYEATSNSRNTPIQPPIRASTASRGPIGGRRWNRGQPTPYSNDRPCLGPSVRGKLASGGCLSPAVGLAFPPQRIQIFLSKFRCSESLRRRASPAGTRAVASRSTDARRASRPEAYILIGVNSDVTRRSVVSRRPSWSRCPRRDGPAGGSPRRNDRLSKRHTRGNRPESSRGGPTP